MMLIGNGVIEMEVEYAKVVFLSHQQLVPVALHCCITFMGISMQPQFLANMSLMGANMHTTQNTSAQVIEFDSMRSNYITPIIPLYRTVLVFTM